MDEIALKSGVTKKTLYDIYGSKDDLLRTAVWERESCVFSTISNTTKKAGIDGLFEAIRKIAVASLEMPMLAKSIARVLINDPGSFEMANLFRELNARYMLPMKDRGQLADWVDTAFLTRSIMLDQTAAQYYWASGVIDDKSLIDFAILSLCHHLHPVAAGPTQRKIAEKIKRLHGSLSAWSYAKGAFSEDGIDIQPPRGYASVHDIAVSRPPVRLNAADR